MNKFQQHCRFSENLYIGLGDQEQENVSRWVNYALLTYAEWADDHFNNEDKDCVIIDSTKKMRYADCETRSFTLCSDIGKPIPFYVRV